MKHGYYAITQTIDISLKKLINIQELRKYIGENAYNVCK